MSVEEAILGPFGMRMVALVGRNPLVHKLQVLYDSEEDRSRSRLLRRASAGSHLSNGRRTLSEAFAGTGKEARTGARDGRLRGGQHRRRNRGKGPRRPQGDAGLAPMRGRRPAATRPRSCTDHGALAKRLAAVQSEDDLPSQAVEDRVRELPDRQHVHGGLYEGHVLSIGKLTNPIFHGLGLPAKAAQGVPLIS